MNAEQNHLIGQVAAHLQAARTARDPLVMGQDQATRRNALRAWQSARLEHTHADLLTSPRYGPAARFFQEELYAPKDFGDRDAALGRILPMLGRWLPTAALETVCRAVELDALSESLDAAMAKALTASGAPIDAKRYTQAYIETARGPDRIRQIELVNEIGLALDALTRHPLIARSLALMRIPALALGMGALHNFLFSGFTAFSHMDGASEFLALIEARERALSTRLFAGEWQALN